MSRKIREGAGSSLGNSFFPYPLFTSSSRFGHYFGGPMVGNAGVYYMQLANSHHEILLEERGQTAAGVL